MSKSDLWLSRPNVGLYIHIPFCRSKCAYCDFNSFASLDHLVPAYVDALLREAAGWSEVLGHYDLSPTLKGPGKLKVGSIYFGGGTPSLLGSSAIITILSACRAAFDVDPKAEITVEANPGTLNTELLAQLLDGGVNRLSIGVQSFNPRLLRTLGRTHSGPDAIQAFKLARAVGFENVNLDLIYGIPTQSLLEWQDDLSHAIELSPAHLSLYGLSVEEGTPISSRIAQGRLDAPDLDLAAEMYSWAGERLRDTGYEQYEISNWAAAGRQCQHNLTYWQNFPYIGLGAGAHSSFCSVRLVNHADPTEYISRLKACLMAETGAGAAPGFTDALRHFCAVEDLSELEKATQMAETAFLGLRLTAGLNENYFLDRFGIEIDEVYGEEIQKLCDVGLLERRRGSISLTSRGRLLGNEVFVHFMPK